MSETFFIADMHIKHKNILEFDQRPFDSIEEHDQMLATNWKSRVDEDDDVFVLGDVHWGTAGQAAEYYGNLPGSKHLIIGNHDHKLINSKKFKDIWCTIDDYKEIILPDKTFLVLSHYPILAFNKHYHGAYHFFGHVHTSMESELMERFKIESEEVCKAPCHMYNVGVMMPYMGYTPRTFEEIIGRKNQNERSN